MASLLKFKKNSTSSKSQREDVAWVLEGIVGYLHSPSWNVPVMNFFDDNCSIFENKEENKLEYTEIHIKYKTLVEKLLAHYIKELGISEELFSQACDQHSSTLNSVEKLFEYIWAADDFLLFKRLMVKHNLEIEMQTINLLQALDGTCDGIEDNPPYNPEFVKSHNKEASASLMTDSQNSLSEDREVMREILDESQDNYVSLLRRQQELEEREASDLKTAIEFSKREMERLNAEAEEERKMLEEAIRLSLEFANLASNTPNAMRTTTESPASPPDVVAESVSNNKFPSPPDVVAEPAASSRKPPSPSDVVSTPDNAAKVVLEEKASYSRPKSIKKISPTVESLPPLRQKSNTDAALDWLTHAQRDGQKDADNAEPSSRFSVDLSTASKGGIDPADLAKRKQYLQEQREKLLSMKKKQREEELLRYQSQSPDSRKDSKQEREDPIATADSDKIMIARRALADRLKREVVMKKL